MANRKEIVAAIISALQNSRIASDNSDLRRSLIRVASSNEELRPHILPTLLEEPPIGRGRSASQLLGKCFRVAYEDPSKREQILPLIRLAMDKLAQPQMRRMKMLRRFKIWADQYKLKGRSPTTDKEILVSSITDFLQDTGKDPLTNSDVKRHYKRFVKIMKDPKKRKAIISKGKKKKEKAKKEEKKFERTSLGKKDPRGPGKQILESLTK